MRPPTGSGQRSTSNAASVNRPARRDHRADSATRWALEAFEALTARGGAWAPPEAVRHRMATWDFDRAERDIGLALEALGLRDELDGILRTVGLASPASLAGDYHLATNPVRWLRKTARIRPRDRGRVTR